MKYILILLTAFTLSACNGNKEKQTEPTTLEGERTAVFADPAITGITLTDLNGLQADTNNLQFGQTYLLKVTYANNATNEVPAMTAYMLIGFGTGFVLDQTLQPDSNFTYAYRKLSGRQGQASAVIYTAIPGGYSGTSIFKVKAAALGATTASVNFLIYNQNPAYILADTKVNNAAAVGYAVK